MEVSPGVTLYIVKKKPRASLRLKAQLVTLLGEAIAEVVGGGEIDVGGKKIGLREFAAMAKSSPQIQAAILGRLARGVRDIDADEVLKICDSLLEGSFVGKAELKTSEQVAEFVDSTMTSKMYERALVEAAILNLGPIIAGVVTSAAGLAGSQSTTPAAT